jgi:hypothetical protein
VGNASPLDSTSTPFSHQKNAINSMNAVLMKKAHFLQILLIASGILDFTFPASAEPLPIFQQILSQIREELPQGLQLRLPTFFPDSKVKLYALARKGAKGSYIINFVNKPHCQDKKIPCLAVGQLLIAPEGTIPIPENRQSIKLTHGIAGWSYQGKKTEYGVIEILSWQQDGTHFAIGGLSGWISVADLVKMANSMITEPVPTIQ